MINRRTLALAAAMLFIGTGAFAVVRVEVGLGGAQYEPDGNLGYKGVPLDVKTNLGYDKVKQFTGRVKLSVPIIPGIYAQANPMKFEGTGSRNVSFQFGDRVFQAGAPITSSLNLSHYDLALFYRVPFLETATNKILNIELGLNGRYVDFKGEVTQPTLALSESKSKAIVVPMGYAGLHISPLDFLKLETELRGVGYGGNRYIDVAARLKVKFLIYGFVAGGYKHQNIVIDQSDIKTDLRFGGPFVEAGIDF